MAAPIDDDTRGFIEYQIARYRYWKRAADKAYEEGRAMDASIYKEAAKKAARCVDDLRGIDMPSLVVNYVDE